MLLGSAIITLNLEKEKDIPQVITNHATPLASEGCFFGLHMCTRINYSSILN